MHLALPNFRNLYRHITDTLSDGSYALVIDYNYPVALFSGTKSVVISTDFWMGGKNVFLGVCYIVVACLCFAAVAFFFIFSKLSNERKAHW